MHVRIAANDIIAHAAEQQILAAPAHDDVIAQPADQDVHIITVIRHVVGVDAVRVIVLVAIHPVGLRSGTGHLRQRFACADDHIIEIRAQHILDAIDVVVSGAGARPDRIAVVVGPAEGVPAGSAAAQPDHHTRMVPLRRAGVIDRVAETEVLVAVPGNLVVTAEDPVNARVALNDVALGPAHQVVVAGAAVDFVVTLLAVYGIVAYHQRSRSRGIDLPDAVIPVPREREAVDIEIVVVIITVDDVIPRNTLAPKARARGLPSVLQIAVDGVMPAATVDHIYPRAAGDGIVPGCKGIREKRRLAQWNVQIPPDKVPAGSVHIGATTGRLLIPAVAVKLVAAGPTDHDIVSRPPPDSVRADGKGTAGRRHHLSVLVGIRITQNPFNNQPEAQDLDVLGHRRVEGVRLAQLEVRYPVAVGVEGRQGGGPEAEQLVAVAEKVIHACIAVDIIVARPA